MTIDDQAAGLDPVLASFDLAGDILAVRPYHAGHINDSYVVTVASGASQRRFLVQRINTAVFTNPVAVMSNILGVTGHLRRKITAGGGDPDRETLTLVPTLTGDWSYTSTAAVWRVYHFIEDTVCYEVAPSTGIFEDAARAFGQFAHYLEDFPAASLVETIPAFHDTPQRYKNFLRAVEADALGRAHEVRSEIEFGLARADDCGRLTSQLAARQLPLRVTHNDTKLTNVLLDPVRHVGCVVDLDTVMPGLLAHDYGDALRMGASTAAEDEPDLDLVHVSLPLVEAFTAGYLATAGGSMTPAEIASLPWGARLMTLECGLRFLTDYLEGDRYFHTSRPGQNLDRARVQFRLLADMERQFEAMTAIVAECSVGI